MSTKLRYASGLAVAVTFLTTLLSAGGSGAAAQSLEPAAIVEPATEFTREPVVQSPAAPAKADEAEAKQGIDAPADVVSQADDGAEEDKTRLSQEMHCLAGAIYFESKGESLEGQLAVGRVVVARSKSGRFPKSYCGVVYQPSQFSFVRGKRMPRIDTSGQSWANAVKMAKIAHEGSRKTPAEGALFFHAARVSPGWRMTRLARIDNHVFYR
jgi:N-acetylmuramoyl-L-alanine amidase